MNLNLDGSSPWFHVHFTLPNQGNKHNEIKYNSQRKRIKELIQNKDAFLAPTQASHRGKRSQPETKPVKKSKDESKRKLDDKELSGTFAERTLWANHSSIKKPSDTQKKGNLIENRIFIDTKTIHQDRKSILPPLEGSKTGVIACCPGQQDKIAESKTNKDELQNTDQQIFISETRTKNTLSIADCYDLCDWKPQTSLCKEARPLVSILKQNTGLVKRTPRPALQGQSSIPSDSSEASGYETENETTKRSKKVRFAKGTKFSPSTRSKRYRKKRNYLDSKFEVQKDLGEENNLEDMIELSFREFIQRKRLERSKVMDEMSKDSNTLCFLKDENKLPKVNTRGRKRNGADKQERASKVDTLLPTVVN